MFILTLKLNMLFMVLTLALRPLQAGLSVLSGYGLMATAFLLPFFSLQNTGDRRIKNHLIFLVFFCVIALMGLLLFIFQVNWAWVKGLMLLFSLYFSIAASSRSFSEKDIRHLLSMGNIMGLIFLLYGYLPFPFRYTEFNAYNGPQFSMGLGNPNGTAISVMFCIGLLLIGCLHRPSTANRIFSFAMIAGLVGLIVRLQCRSVFFCTVLLLLFYFLRIQRPKKYMVLLTLLVPVLFLFLQAAMALLFQYTDILGKPLLTGRQDMFFAVFRQISREPLHYLLGSPGLHQLENLHNAPLTLLCNFGLFGFLMYFFFWKGELDLLTSRKDSTPVQRFCVMFLMIFLLHSSAEAGVMIGTALYGTPFMVIARLAKDSFSDAEQEMQEEGADDGT